MVRKRNEALGAEWQDRVAGYERRAESSAEFCRRECVSVVAQFSRRRRLVMEGGRYGLSVAGGLIRSGWDASSRLFSLHTELALAERHRSLLAQRVTSTPGTAPTMVALAFADMRLNGQP